MSLRGYIEAQHHSSLTADVVVVGSGPGGAAVSRALAEGGARVVIVEEGPSTPRFRPNMPHTMRYHQQENGTMVAQGSGFIAVAAGRGVGGGSLINSAICFRTPDHVLESWSAPLGGDTSFAPAAMSPVFAELEEILEIAETPEDIAGENNMLIVRGVKQLGLPGGLVRRNTPRCVGCGVCNYGCPSGGKASVDRNLIPMALERGAIVQADTRVEEILIEGDRVVGVAGTARHTDTREPVGRVTVRADKVVIACGGVGTPRLLHSTGVASRLGDRVGVGLHLHPGNAVFGICDHEVQMWKGATQGAYFEDPELPGVLPHTLSAPPGILLVVMGKTGMEAKESMALLPRMCGAVVMISDHGEGTVGAKRNGSANIKYWFDDGDVERIKAGMVRTAEVLLAGGAKQVFGGVHGGGVHDNLDDFAAAMATRRIHDFDLYASHPMATCRMGADPAASVIGPTGESHGLRGLYIADSSIFPTSLGVNPQLTTMAVGTVIGRKLVS